MAKSATAHLRPPFLKAALIGLVAGLVGAGLQFGTILHTADAQVSVAADKLLAKASDTAKIAVAAPALGIGDVLAQNLMQAGFIAEVKLLNDQGKMLAGRHAQIDQAGRHPLTRILDRLGFTPRAYSRTVVMAPDPQDPTDKGAKGTLEITIDRAAAIAATMSRATIFILVIAFVVVGAAGTGSTLGFWHRKRKKEALKRAGRRA